MWNFFYKKYLPSFTLGLKHPLKYFDMCIFMNVHTSYWLKCLAFIVCRLIAPWNHRKTTYRWLFIKSCKETAAFPLLMRYLVKITDKLYLLFHSIVFMYCPTDSKLTMFTAHLFYIYKYTEYCFIQSSSPYIFSALCNYFI